MHQISARPSPSPTEVRVLPANSCTAREGFGKQHNFRYHIRQVYVASRMGRCQLCMQLVARSQQVRAV